MNICILQLKITTMHRILNRCGLHADFTELTACVGGELDRHEGSAVHRRYFYITLLREPVARWVHLFIKKALKTNKVFRYYTI